MTNHYQGKERRTYNRREEDDDSFNNSNYPPAYYPPYYPQPQSDITKQSVGLKDLFILCGGLIAIAISAFTVWNDLNAMINTNHNEFILFKNTYERQAMDNEKSIVELRTTLVDVNKNIMDLNNTISQLYGKINDTNKLELYKK